METHSAESGPNPENNFAHTHSRPYKAWICPVDCFVYEEHDGVPELGIKAGTRWEELPEDWSCPLCGEHRSSFESVQPLER